MNTSQNPAREGLHARPSSFAALEAAASLSPTSDTMEAGGADTTHPLVLIADDDRTIRAVLTSSLDRNGFRVVTAANGAEALALALQEIPDMILLDVRMPIMDGFEVVKQLRHHPTTMRIPVILLTALARESSDAAHGLNLGADDYLHKPFGVDELLARVVRKIHDRRLEDRLQRRTQELEALITIGVRLNETLSIEDVADRLMQLTLETISADLMGMIIRNGRDLSGYRRVPGQPLEPTPSEFPIAAHVLKTERQILLTTRTELEHDLPFVPMDWIQSVLGAPMIHNGQALGALVLVSGKPHHFTHSSLRLLRSIAEQAALALRNAQLYGELSGYASGLESMVEARTAALLSAQRQLTQSEKLAAIGTLAAGVAHEVNNPLQPILTNLELAIEDIDLGRQVNREDLESAYQHVNRIKSIVRRLLDFARPESHQMRPIRLRDLAEEVLALTAKQFQQSRIDVRRAWAPDGTDAPDTIGNADQLKQVILNLIVNAWEVMASGGVLTVATELTETETLLRIEDNGPGIPSEHFTRIFDPFFTTKATGTGIGLAMSLSIVEGHGGHLEAENVAEHGARFTIRLPRYQHAAAARPAESAESAEPAEPAEPESE